MHSTRVLFTNTLAVYFVEHLHKQVREETTVYSAGTSCLLYLVQCFAIVGKAFSL